MIINFKFYLYKVYYLFLIRMERKINISFINKKHTLVIFCVLLTFCANLRLSYSQNIVPDPSYCNSDPPTTFRINSPGGKTWTSNVPGVIVNTFLGEAVFSPALVPGPYPRVIIIRYQNPNCLLYTSPSPRD